MIYKSSNEVEFPIQEISENISSVVLYLSMLENEEYGTLNNIQLRKIKQTKHHAQRIFQYIESYNQSSLKPSLD